jgi:UDP-2-acetamido-3-amino-2,3-dideoxy-glucuronate N-acetyltransferase
MGRLHHLPGLGDGSRGWRPYEPGRPQTYAGPKRPVAKPVITPDVTLGRNVVIPHPELVNLYGCRIGDGCKIASFVEIQRGVVLGKNVKVEAFAFIPTGVTIEDGAFIGPHVCFTNDRYPRAVSDDGEQLGSDDWQVVPTLVKRGAAIGANATIVCGVTIGEGAMVGAGSTITRDVPARSLVLGTPGRVVPARRGVESPIR